MSNNTMLFALYRLGYKGKMTGHAPDKSGNIPQLQKSCRSLLFVNPQDDMKSAVVT